MKLPVKLPPPPSVLFDLLEQDGNRHSHHKTVAFLVIVATLVLVGGNLRWGTRPLTWPEVALLGFLVAAAYGTGVLKALIQLAYAFVGAKWSGGGVSAPPIAPHRTIADRRVAGAHEGAEPT